MLDRFCEFISTLATLPFGGVANFSFLIGWWRFEIKFYSLALEAFANRIRSSLL